MRQVTTRVPAREYEHLSKFCEVMERTQSDVIRELIRKLSISGVLNPMIDHLSILTPTWVQVWCGASDEES